MTTFSFIIHYILHDDQKINNQRTWRRWGCAKKTVCTIAGGISRYWLLFMACCFISEEYIAKREEKKLIDILLRKISVFSWVCSKFVASESAVAKQRFPPLILMTFSSFMNFNWHLPLLISHIPSVLNYNNMLILM